MQKIEIGYRADGQHVMAARDSLNKSVLIVKRDNIAFAQALHGWGIQRVFIQRFNAQIKREVQIHLL